MGLYVPAGSDFKWQASTIDGVRPAAAMGNSIAAATAAPGAWVQMMSSAAMVNDAYGIMINVNSAFTSATTRNYLVDVGIDNAGGTNYQVKIPTLVAGHAATYSLGSGGVWYYFPLFIPKNSSIAMRAQGNVTTAIRGFVTVYGQPRRPDSVRVGSKVFAFGINTTTKSPTPATLGTTAKSAWTSVGTTTMPLWWWQVGYSCVDTTMAASAVNVDVAAGSSGTNPKIMIQDNTIVTGSTEYISNLPLTAGCSSNVATGDNIYVRGWSSTTPDTNVGVSVYGLGG